MFDFLIILQINYWRMKTLTAFNAGRGSLKISHRFAYKIETPYHELMYFEFHGRQNALKSIQYDFPIKILKIKKSRNLHLIASLDSSLLLILFPK